MNPRRLIPYAVVFLALAAAYLGLQWRQERRHTQEEQAKKVFQLESGEIGEISLIRGKEEIRLVKKDKEWQIVKPLEAKADPAIVESLTGSLANLRKERDLGAEKELKPFGLDKPALVVKFQAQGTAHQLTLGGKAPGGRSNYALKDQDPQVLLIGAGIKDSLDRPLASLRDKTLVAFSLEAAKGVKIKMDKTAVQLEKTGPASWRWAGRDNFKVRSDRVDALLRQLHTARVKEFLETLPKDLKAAGLAPPPQAEVIVATDKGQETLWLGAKKDAGVYARKGATGAVVLADANLPAEIAKAAANLEERRLFTGAILDVNQVSWGPPSKSWVALKEKDSWKITGPEKAEVTQPAARLEMSLYKLQNLEYSSTLPAPATPADQDAYRLELRDGAGQPLFLLVDLGKKEKAQAEVLARMGDKEVRAVIPRQPWVELQENLTQLTKPPQK